MTKRLKAKPLTTEADFIRTINEAASLQSKAATLIAERDARIVEIQNEYAEQLSPIENEIDKLVALADGYAQSHRDALLPKGKKSVELAIASYGWRTGNRTVKLLSRMTAEGVIAMLKGAGLGAYVRQVEEIAKDKILSDCKDDKTLHMHRVSVTTADEDADVSLSSVGLKISQSETFFIEPKAESGETLTPASA